MGCPRNLRLVLCVIVLAVVADKAYGKAVGEQKKLVVPLTAKKGGGTTSPPKQALGTPPAKKSGNKTSPPKQALGKPPARKSGDRTSPPKQALGKPPRFPFPPPVGPVPTIKMPKGPWKGIYLVYPPIDLRLAPTRVKWDTL
ncbi:nascent polypeptide-associated complex subunit alpha, muscle-specific form-like [Dermacentor albipictus]|uniref:nascent polypeptide-associated complex subunit alpha, muscle-specific form-like n=1 Tax=Dermacentor albipictus TaxID=60249 RepID=UPI0038FD28B6